MMADFVRMKNKIKVTEYFPLDEHENCIVSKTKYHKTRISSPIKLFIRLKMKSLLALRFIYHLPNRNRKETNHQKKPRDYTTLIQWIGNT